MPWIDEVIPPPTVEGDPAAEPPKPAQPPLLERREIRIALITLISILLLGAISFTVIDVKFARMINRRLSTGPFADSVNIYTAPQSVSVGDSLTADQVVSRLLQSGYTTARSNTVGWYHVRPNGVEIFPGRNSYSGGDPAVIEFSNAKVSRIVSLADNSERKQYEMEPQLLGSVSGQREKRRLVRFADIPTSLVHAVTSIEDKHFFSHSGFDLLRIMKAAYVDVKDGRKAQGASTLTMQLARGFWLDPDKNWRRKLEELLITMHLEQRLTKQQIFEYYANQVYLGRRGTFSIHGFGEAAATYFGKDLSQINTAEAALLAGMVQRPSYYNPQRSPERARERRDLVLNLMRQNGLLDEKQYRQALTVPVTVAPLQYGSIDHQYFVDLMNEELQSRFDDHEKHTGYIYTTLDPELQQAAEEAVRMGMQLVDKELQKGKKRDAIPKGQPQVALIALDPHTGEIRALSGGRNYSASQLNHVLAMRQPGSVFKPFVYAAALNSAIEGGSEIFTPATVVDDSPRTFYFNRKPYQPSNFHRNFMGEVTLRTALAHSLNVATVELAEEVGFDKVVAMARRAGLNNEIKATPAVALGSYETTPYEVAGAYTMFANSGQRVTPTTIALVRGPDGAVLHKHQADPRPTLDPRVNYLMVSMMQDVLRYGTGGGVRSRGFTLPAAGKTGTSRDGWFAGFTSELLCVVWVGFDDNRDLNLEGAKSALPIWAEFMKRAAKMRQYKDAKAFATPKGIVSDQICSDSGQLAGQYCPNVRTEYFIDGTEPAVECQLHSLQPLGLADRVLDAGPEPASRVPIAAQPAKQ
jgi:penicillin-binding protein 1B